MITLTVTWNDGTKELIVFDSLDGFREWDEVHHGEYAGFELKNTEKGRNHD